MDTQTTQLTPPDQTGAPATLAPTEKPSKIKKPWRTVAIIFISLSILSLAGVITLLCLYLNKDTTPPIENLTAAPEKIDDTNPLVAAFCEWESENRQSFGGKATSNCIDKVQISTSDDYIASIIVVNSTVKPYQYINNVRIDESRLLGSNYSGNPVFYRNSPEDKWRFFLLDFDPSLQCTQLSGFPDIVKAFADWGCVKEDRWFTVGEYYGLPGFETDGNISVQKYLELNSQYYFSIWVPVSDQLYDQVVIYRYTNGEPTTDEAMANGYSFGFKTCNGGADTGLNIRTVSTSALIYESLQSVWDKFSSTIEGEYSHYDFMNSQSFNPLTRHHVNDLSRFMIGYSVDEDKLTCSPGDDLQTTRQLYRELIGRLEDSI